MSEPAARSAQDLRQRWPLARAPRPIVILGAGGIVHDAHLPAYRAAGYPVAGLYDIDRARAERLAREFEVPRVFASENEAFSVADAVFDLALPPAAMAGSVERLPRGAFALLQKPMGLDLADATRIRRACRERGLTAALNFQLRSSPMMLALGDALERGSLGRIVELDVHVNCRMPWELWPFLESLERMEIAMHSIHYLDLIRSFLGEPLGVYARTVKHPDAPRLSSSRTSAILDYGDEMRCSLSVNHHHKQGPKHQCSTLRIEGTRGAAIATLGVNLDYPTGRPDALEIALDGADWQSVPLVGNWFPDAFQGPMSELQRAASGEGGLPRTHVEDAWHTMALVEALYESDERGGTPLPNDPEPRGARP